MKTPIFHKLKKNMIHSHKLKLILIRYLELQEYDILEDYSIEFIRNIDFTLSYYIKNKDEEINKKMREIEYKKIIFKMLSDIVGLIRNIDLFVKEFINKENYKIRSYLLNGIYELEKRREDYIYILQN